MTHAALPFSTAICPLTTTSLRSAPRLSFAAPLLDAGRLFPAVASRALCVGRVAICDGRRLTEGTRCPLNDLIVFRGRRLELFLASLLPQENDVFSSVHPLSDILSTTSLFSRISSCASVLSWNTFSRVSVLSTSQLRREFSSLSLLRDGRCAPAVQGFCGAWDNVSCVSVLSGSLSLRLRSCRVKHLLWSVGRLRDLDAAAAVSSSHVVVSAV